MASNDHTKDSNRYEKWKQYVIDIKSEQECPNTTMWNIYEVPSELRNLNEDAYTPQSVSIGPLHYGQGQLNAMQEQKLRYLGLFWSWDDNKIRDMDLFKMFLDRKQCAIRQCYYAEKLWNINKEELVEIMLLDSVFIMELFLRIQRQKSAAGECRYSDDVIVKQSWLKKSIQRDLLLLENQIPFFILEELYEEFVPNSRKVHPTFIELACSYFGYYLTYKKGYKEKKSSSGEKKGSSDSEGDAPRPKHFTDLIRSFYIYKDINPRKRGFRSRKATKLQEAGVIFETVNDRPLLEIKFQKYPILSWFLCLACIPKFKMVEARLEIPQLIINHTEKIVLSNIMALEQLHYVNQAYICDYVLFLDSLIRTTEDVKLLVEKEVIVHTLRSDMEVENLVHGLCGNVVTNTTCYADIIKELNRYYQRMWWNRGMLELRSVYFRDLWRASSTIIGLVVFMFTILNTYQTIRGFYVVKN